MGGLLYLVPDTWTRALELESLDESHVLMR